MDDLFNELDARYNLDPTEHEEMLEEWNAMFQIPSDALPVDEIWNAERKKSFIKDKGTTNFLKNFGGLDG